MRGSAVTGCSNSHSVSIAVAGMSAGSADPYPSCIRVFSAGPVITAGVILGIDAVATQPSAQLGDFHKRLGVALWILFYVQCLLGFVIHMWKPSSFAITKKRPAQNYGHVVFGLLIIGLAFAEVGQHTLHMFHAFMGCSL